MKRPIKGTMPLFKHRVQYYVIGHARLMGELCHRLAANPFARCRHLAALQKR
jgi:hypothetical protein